MKSIFAIILFSVSTYSHAALKFICKEITQNEYDMRSTMILTQSGNISIKEGVKYPFHLEIYEPNGSKPAISERVSVETEDVVLSFKNAAKKIHGVIYMDEFEETSVSIGKKNYNFDCR